MVEGRLVGPQSTQGLGSVEDGGLTHKTWNTRYGLNVKLRRVFLSYNNNNNKQDRQMEFLFLKGGGQWGAGG